MKQLTISAWITRDRYGYSLHYKEPRFSKALSLYVRNKSNDLPDIIAKVLLGRLPRRCEHKAFSIPVALQYSTMGPFSSGGEINYKMNDEEGRMV